MLPLLLLLLQAPPEGRVAWDIGAGGAIENCRMLKSTGDRAADARVCAAVACAQKADVRTAQGELLRYRKELCGPVAPSVKPKR